MCALSLSYWEYVYCLCGGRDRYWRDCPNTPFPQYSNPIASSYYDFDRSYDKKKKEQYDEDNKIKSMLQIIFNRVDTIGDDI